MDYSKYNYFIFLILTSFLLFLFEDKQKPSYNPFDDLFQVDMEQLVTDSCDTIYSTCGYWNLAKIKSDFAAYYQYFGFDSDVVVAKGFVFYVDTFLISSADNHPDSLDTLPIHSTRIDRLTSIMHRFHFSVDTIEKHEISVISHDKSDTFLLDLRTYLAERYPQEIYVRQLGIFVNAPTNPTQKFKNFIDRNIEAYYWNHSEFSADAVD